jgi:IS605 OrfB family transposase
MDIQRTVTIVIEPDPDLRQTLTVFREVQAACSPVAFNDGRPLGPIALQKRVYHAVKGRLNRQMTISAIRQVAAAYRSASSNGTPATRPFVFRKARALFLVGKRGRDADFRADGTLSIWTVAGRKRLSYTVPDAFNTRLHQAKEIDSLTVIERDGMLLGRVTVTLAVPDPVGTVPVGIDLNETNALVAVDPDGTTFVASGKAVKVANWRTQKTRSRLQRKLAARKAEHKDTSSVRRVLKRLGRIQRNRTRTFARQTAAALVAWVPSNAVLVFEDLRGVVPPKRGTVRGKALRRRLARWQRREIRSAVEQKAQMCGLRVTEVDPAYTSRICSRCGVRGNRSRHRFACPFCGSMQHADINTAQNIRLRYTVLRDGGPLSTGPEALPGNPGEGKLSALADSR